LEFLAGDQGIGVYFLIPENYREIQESNHAKNPLARGRARTFYPLFMIFPYVRDGSWLIFLQGNDDLGDILGLKK
jgi:hypothetical protein